MSSSPPGSGFASGVGHGVDDPSSVVVGSDRHQTPAHAHAHTHTDSVTESHVDNGKLSLFFLSLSFFLAITCL